MGGYDYGLMVYGGQFSEVSIYYPMEMLRGGRFEPFKRKLQKKRLTFED